MKSLIAYTLIFSVFLISLSNCITILEFELNKNHISKVLCENINKPKLKCDGKCQLQKKLNEGENNGKEKKAYYIDKTDNLVLFQTKNYITLKPFPNIRCFYSIDNLQSQSYHSIHFRPPKNLI